MKAHFTAQQGVCTPQPGPHRGLQAQENKQANEQSTYQVYQRIVNGGYP